MAVHGLNSPRKILRKALTRQNRRLSPLSTRTLQAANGAGQLPGVHLLDGQETHPTERFQILKVNTRIIN